MKLITILVALGLLQLWGEKNPLHRDALLYKWHSWLDEKLLKTWGELAPLVIFLGLPVVAVFLLATNVPNYVYLIVALIVLLYSLGRGQFAPHLEEYTEACTEGDWAVAVESIRSAGIDLDDVSEGDWSSLNQEVLEQAAYQGFERLFAVLFWFIFFGPAGALLYRLSYFVAEQAPTGRTLKWKWALEWPAVRLLSVSFAVTGNFVGCINRWKAYVICVSSPASVILRETTLGALSIDDELVQSCDCTHREIRALKKLYARTLWLWVAVVAIFTILN